MSGAVGAEMIDALPNITQNPLAYAFLQSGAVPRNAASDTQNANSFGIGVDGRRQFSAVGINGGRAFTNDIQLDGLPVMGGGYNETSVVPNTEGLQEVRVISNNFSAEYGRGQAVIAMSTKSGTNAFRGQGVYMMRHEGLDANTFCNNAQAIPKREFRVNDVGGSIGGPILRNRLFFFSSYHGLRNNQSATTLLTVPTALERVGQLQSVVHSRRERQRRSRAHLRSVERRAGRSRPLPPRRDSRTPPSPTRIRSRCGCSASTRMPNRTPDDVYNTNNFEATTLTTIRRHSSNNRVDFRGQNHSIYGSGGISYAEIITPRPFGTGAVQ